MANLLDFDLEGLAAFCERLGEKRFRATQLFRWIHQKGVADFDQMSDLAKSLRGKLRGRAIVRHRPSSASTSRGRHHQVAVRRRRRQCGRGGLHPRGRPRHAVRVVAGRLRRGCRFCSTGHQGFQPQPRAPARSSPAVVCRALPASPPEDRPARHLQRGDDGHGRAAAELRRLVPALRTMLDDHGYGLSRRRVTVSTSGVVPMIERLAQDCPVALAVSLHAPTTRCATPGAAQPQVPDR
jgi:23S rRNA (adenine2503-C2)-methyltransferase